MVKRVKFLKMFINLKLVLPSILLFKELTVIKKTIKQLQHTSSTSTLKTARNSNQTHRNREFIGEYAYVTHQRIYQWGSGSCINGA